MKIVDLLIDNLKLWVEIPEGVPYGFLGICDNINEVINNSDFTQYHYLGIGCDLVEEISKKWSLYNGSPTFPVDGGIEYSELRCWSTGSPKRLLLCQFMVDEMESNKEYYENFIKELIDDV